MKMFNIKRSVVMAVAAVALTAGAASTAKADDCYRGGRSYYSYRDYGCGPRSSYYSSYYRSGYGPRYYRSGWGRPYGGGFGISVHVGRGYRDGYYRHGGWRRGCR